MEDNPSEIYGRVVEGIHISGYTLERAWGGIEKLLAGDNWRQVGGGFTDVNVFLDSIRLDSFRIIADQRKRIAARIKELQPAASNRAIAKTLGTVGKTIDRDVATNVAPDQKKPNIINDRNPSSATNVAPLSLSGAEAATAIRRADTKLVAAEETKQRREASRRAQPVPDGLDLRIGDCRTVLADIGDNSVPLVLTDPPYGDEAEPLYHWLAGFAARVLVPGGSLICYTGSSRLDRDIAIMSSVCLQEILPPEK
jgi:hypothetical protein